MHFTYNNQALIRNILAILVYYRVTEDYNLVPNPIYYISLQRTDASNPQQGTTTSVATGNAAVIYEIVGDLGLSNKSSTNQVNDMHPLGSDAPAMGQLGGNL